MLHWGWNLPYGESTWPVLLSGPLPPGTHLTQFPTSGLPQALFSIPPTTHLDRDALSYLMSLSLVLPDPKPPVSLSKALPSRWGCELGWTPPSCLPSIQPTVQARLYLDSSSPLATTLVRYGSGISPSLPGREAHKTKARLPAALPGRYSRIYKALCTHSETVSEVTLSLSRPWGPTPAQPSHPLQSGDP